MFRTRLAGLTLFASALFATGCGLTRNNCNNCCDDRPGLFSRFRMASNHGAQPVIVSNGDCCGQEMMGPVLPVAPPPGSVLPPPANNIPRIDENGKQMPWDPKMSGRSGTKTGEVRMPKEGI